MSVRPFAVTSLEAPFGLSDVSAFFFADRIVLCEMGATWEPWHHRYEPRGDVAAWCDAMRAAAESVVVVPDHEVESVRVRLGVLRHEIWIARTAGAAEAVSYRDVRRSPPDVLEYTMAGRADAQHAVRLLAARFGDRFDLAPTRPYALVRRALRQLVG